MRTRSIFWPLVLIAVGVVWILAQAGGMPQANLWALLYVLPYALVLLGLGMILGTRWWWARQVVSILVVGAGLAAVVFAGPLRWNVPPDWGCAWGDTPLAGCFWEGGAVRGSGVIVSETREVGAIDSVSVDYPAAVTILQGGTQSVTVEADDNFLPQLRTRVVDGTLHIEAADMPYGQRVTPTREVRITLTVKDLKQLDLSSAGSVKVTGLETGGLNISVSGTGSLALSELSVQTLTIDLSGAGSVTAGGQAQTLRLDISGVGSFHGDALEVQTASADISGMGSATLWVKESLTADISGTGSVRYYGSPAVRKDVSGLGSVRSLGDK